MNWEIKKAEKVLAVGSGPNMTLVNDWDTSDCRVVGINNIWKGTDKWDHLIVAGDYPERKKIKKEIVPNFNNKGLHKTWHSTKGTQRIQEAMLAMDDKPIDSKPSEFDRSCIKLGVPAIFTVTYWCLHFLKPKFIGYIGFDMDYTPKKDGATAFYGVGYDIKTNGIPDPILQMKKYYNGDENFMTPLFKQIQTKAPATQFFNLSDNKNTRLPWQQIGIEEFKKL
jgi:hypothetical protein